MTSASNRGSGRSYGALAVMILFTVWSGVLALGFGITVGTAYEELGGARTIIFVFLAVLLAALAVRTLVEMVRGPRD